MTAPSHPANPIFKMMAAASPLRKLVALVVLLAVGLLFWKLVKDNTTVSFTFLLDGKPLSGGTAPVVQIDGKAFTSGLTISPGLHKLTVEFKNAEPFSRRVWVFFGAKNLGALPLETSKGSLLVSVNPSPATVIVRRGVEVLGKGNAPLTVENLPIGDYELEIKRNEYKEVHPVKIQGKPRTAAKIELNLGSVELSATPTNADFKLSGSGRQWEGKLPVRLEDVGAGSYKLVMRLGGHEETHQLEVHRQQRSQTNILLNLGSVDLSATPTNADFKLLGNGREWEGRLPVRLDDVPVGDYRLHANRGGWELSDNITVQRASISTNKIKFPYGTLEIRSEPLGLSISTNGVEIGKAPVTLRELRPGQYTVTAEDKDNQLTTSINVGPGEAAKYTFPFRYGGLQLDSIPTGASVFLGNKGIGKTPLLIARIPAGERTLEFRLEGHLSTNLLVRTLEGVTTNYSAKLLSERYLQAMKKARETFDAVQLSESLKSLTVALESEPNDSAALKLREEVSQAVAKAEEMLRLEKAKEKAQVLASLPWLDFQKAISDCTDTKQVTRPVVFNVGYDETYVDGNGKKKTRFVVTGQRTEMQTSTESTFNPTKFSDKYVGRPFRFNSLDKWNMSKVDNDGVMTLKARGLLDTDQIKVTPPTSNRDALKALQKGQKVIIKAVVRKIERGFIGRTLYLDDAEILDK